MFFRKHQAALAAGILACSCLWACSPDAGQQGGGEDAGDDQEASAPMHGKLSSNENKDSGDGEDADDNVNNVASGEDSVKDTTSAATIAYISKDPETGILSVSDSSGMKHPLPDDGRAYSFCGPVCEGRFLVRWDEAGTSPWGGDVGAVPHYEFRQVDGDKVLDLSQTLSALGIPMRNTQTGAVVEVTNRPYFYSGRAVVEFSCASPSDPGGAEAFGMVVDESGAAIALCAMNGAAHARVASVEAQNLNVRCFYDATEPLRSWARFAQSYEDGMLKVMESFSEGAGGRQVALLDRACARKGTFPLDGNPDDLFWTSGLVVTPSYISTKSSVSSYVPGEGATATTPVLDASRLAADQGYDSCELEGLAPSGATVSVSGAKILDDSSQRFMSGVYDFSASEWLAPPVLHARYPSPDLSREFSFEGVCALVFEEDSVEQRATKGSMGLLGADGKWLVAPGAYQIRHYAGSYWLVGSLDNAYLVDASDSHPELLRVTGELYDASS